MARSLRIEFPGAAYHVINRGDRREPIFRNDDDRRLFLETLEEAQLKTNWLIHCYCLMNNHFHLVVETPEPNLVAGMKWFLGTFTGRINRRHNLTGHLFGGRYKAPVISPSSGYFLKVCDYVHLNPVRAGLIAKHQAITNFPWSSLPGYLSKNRHRWLCYERVFLESKQGDTASGRRALGVRLENLRNQDSESMEGLRRGWHVGDDAHKAKLLERLEKKATISHEAVHRYNIQEKKANKIIQVYLTMQDWTESDLSRFRKSNPLKIQLARHLRKETTLSFGWLAKRLSMGTAGSLAVALHRPNKLKN